MLRWLGKTKFMTFYFQYLLMLDLFRWHKTRGWTTFSKLIKSSWSLLPLFPCIDKLLIFINWSEKLRSIKRFSKTNSDHGVFLALIFYHDAHMTFFFTRILVSEFNLLHPRFHSLNHSLSETRRKKGLTANIIWLWNRFWRIREL